MIVSRSCIMHPQSPPWTIGRTVLKESDDLAILGVTLDSLITFENHLRSVSWAASQRLCILRKSWRVFHDWTLLGRSFRGFVLPVLEYSSAVWCSAADTHLKLQDRAVSGARFLTVGAFACCIQYRRSVVVLCMLYKIRCNPMHPLNGALPAPYVSVWDTRGALVAHRYTYAPPRCRTSQYCRSLSVLQERSWWPCILWCGTCGFQKQGQLVFYLPKLLYHYYSFLVYFPFSYFCQ